MYLPRQVLVGYIERGGNFNGAKQQRVLDQRQASPGKGGEVLICGPVAAKQAMQGIAVVLGSGEPVRQAQHQLGASSGGAAGVLLSGADRKLGGGFGPGLPRRRRRANETGAGLSR